MLLGVSLFLNFQIQRIIPVLCLHWGTHLQIEKYTIEEYFKREERESKLLEQIFKNRRKKQSSETKFKRHKYPKKCKNDLKQEKETGKQAVLSTILTRMNRKRAEWLQPEIICKVESDNDVSPQHTNTNINWSNPCINGKKTSKITLNIHHQKSEDEPKLLSAWISLNEQLEHCLLLQIGIFHGKLDSDHSYMDNHPLIVLYYPVFQQVPEIW